MNPLQPWHKRYDSVRISLGLGFMVSGLVSLFMWVGRVSGCRVCRGTVALARMFRRGKCVYRGDDGGVGDTDEDEKKNAGKCTTEVVCFMEKAHTLVPPHANTVPQQLGSILCALSKRIYIIKAKP